MTRGMMPRVIMMGAGGFDRVRQRTWVATHLQDDRKLVKAGVVEIHPILSAFAGTTARAGVPVGSCIAESRPMIAAASVALRSSSASIARR